MMPEQAHGQASMVERGGFCGMEATLRFADSHGRIELQPGDYVTVSASRYPFANVLPHNRRGEDWVQSISKTLNWNSREKQKSFK
jgi:NAD kinase